MKKVNGRTGKGQHQVKGVKVVTSRRFAEVNGIAVGLNVGRGGSHAIAANAEDA